MAVLALFEGMPRKVRTQVVSVHSVPATVITCSEAIQLSMTSFRRNGFLSFHFCDAQRFPEIIRTFILLFLTGVPVHNFILRLFMGSDTRERSLCSTVFLFNRFSNVCDIRNTGILPC